MTEKNTNEKKLKNFIMTKYMYPIKKKEIFFDGLYFDNPRTEEEIE